MVIADPKLCNNWWNLKVNNDEFAKLVSQKYIIKENFFDKKEL